MPALYEEPDEPVQAQDGAEDECVCLAYAPMIGRSGTCVCDLCGNTQVRLGWMDD